MRASLQKLLEGYKCFSYANLPGAVNNKWSNCVIYVSVIGTRSLSMSDYLVGLESSGWLRHIKSVVDAAVFLTKVIFCLFSIFIMFRCQSNHRVPTVYLNLSPQLLRGASRLWQWKEPACWFIVQMGGTGQLRSALWGRCSWTPTTAPSRASW